MSGATQSSRVQWAGVAAICLLALLLRLPIAGIPLERDEGESAYTAQRWMQGDIPYRDLSNRQLPGTFIAYAVAESVFGDSANAIHWAAQLYTLGTLTVLFLLGRRLSSPAGGLAAAALAALMTADASVHGNAAPPELFMLLPLAGAMLALGYAIESDTLWWACATGALGAIAVLCAPAALANLLFSVGAIAALSQRRVANMVALLLAAAGIALPLVVYFAAHGAWSALYGSVVTYSPQTEQGFPIANYPHTFWQQSQTLVRSFWPILLLATTQIIAGGFLNTPASAREASGSTARRNTLLVLMWLAASGAGAWGGGLDRAHPYVQLIPPLAVLGGMAVNVVARGRFRVAIGVGLVLVPLAVAILSNTWYYGPGDAPAKSMQLYSNSAFIAAPALGRFIADRSDPQDTVFVLGSEAEILHAAAHPSATRYIIAYPLTGPFPDARQRQLEALREVQGRQPRFIVTVFLPGSFLAGPGTPGDIFDGTMDLINRSYRLAGVVEVSPSNLATPLVSGAEATAAWLLAPAWYGQPSWCALAVWERVPPADAASRAAAEAERRAGAALAAKGDDAGAMAHFREAIRLDPDFGPTHNNLAAALAKAGQIDEAITQYAEAIRLSPLRAEPHWNLAMLLQDAGRLPEALPHLRAAVLFNPKVEMRYRLAAASADTGHVPEAEAEFESVLRERPDSNGAETRMAWLLATAPDARLRNGPRAVQLAEDAAQRTERRDASVLNSLAAAYAEVGRYEDAAAVAAEAIEVAPFNGQAALRDPLTARLARYRARQPVRDGAGVPPS